MSLSVLSIGTGFDKFALWHGDTILATGPQEELFSLKNIMEFAQQEKDNAAWRKAHKEKLLGMLTAPGSGNTLDDADIFLKKQMPFLYE